MKTAPEPSILRVDDVQADLIYRGLEALQSQPGYTPPDETSIPDLFAQLEALKQP